MEMKNVLKRITALVVLTVMIAVPAAINTDTAYGLNKEKFIIKTQINEAIKTTFGFFDVSGEGVSTPQISSASVDDSNNISLTWQEVEGAECYLIYRCEKSDGEYEKVGISETSSYVDTDLKGGKEYFYKVSACAGKLKLKRGEASETASGCTKLSAPENFKASFDEGTSQASFSWNKVDGASKYIVYKKVWDGGFRTLASTDSTSYAYNVNWNGKYAYKVAAVYVKNGKEIVSALSSEQSFNVTTLPENEYARKKIALTFDDGPGPYTKSIVDCLNANNARATFFVVGNRASTYSSALLYAYQSGHEIGNHSYSHPMLTGLSADGIAGQMNSADAAISAVTGQAPTIMRPPGGAINQTVRENVGKPMINWSLDTLDWKTRSKDATVNAVMNNVREGDIILMHDIHEPSMEAALELIPLLRSEGYDLCTVSELASAKGCALQNGALYRYFR